MKFRWNYTERGKLSVKEQLRLNRHYPADFFTSGLSDIESM